MCFKRVASGATVGCMSQSLVITLFQTCVHTDVQWCVLCGGVKFDRDCIGRKK